MMRMLRAGVAVRYISPQTPMHLVGYPHVPRISTGIHDPLLASALCLRQGAEAVMLVAVDLLFLNPSTAREIRRRVAESSGIPEACVFISCTHTHSAPVTAEILSWRDDPTVPPPDSDYLQQVDDGILAAACEAAETPFDAEIAWTTGDVLGVGGNRLEAGGLTDPEVGILVVRDSDSKRLIALSTIYAMHPTVLHEDSTMVSADFPGYTRLQLREAFGDDLVVVYQNGPCGNQSPRASVKAQTFAEAERLGRMLGQRIIEAVQSVPAQAFASSTTLAGELGAISPVSTPMPSVAEAEAVLALRVAEYDALVAADAGHVPVRTAECSVFGAEETVTLARAQANGDLARLHTAYQKAEVQVVRIGESCLVGWPGELFTEYGLDLKRRSPVPAFPISLVNGELQGYIVTEDAIAIGGYEAANRVFEPATGTLLVEEGLRLIESVTESTA